MVIKGWWDANCEQSLQCSGQAYWSSSPLISRAVQCVPTQHAQRKIPTPLPDYPWQQVATDLFTLNGLDYSVIVDYFSHYPEVIQLTTSQSVINTLKSAFARHGIPESQKWQWPTIHLQRICRVLRGPTESTTSRAVLTTQLAMDKLRGQCRQSSSYWKRQKIRLLHFSSTDPPLYPGVENHQHSYWTSEPQSPRSLRILYHNGLICLNFEQLTTPSRRGRNENMTVTTELETFWRSQITLMFGLIPVDTKQKGESSPKMPPHGPALW